MTASGVAPRHFWPRPRTLVIASMLVGAALAGLLVEARINGVGPLARPEFSQVTTLPLVLYPVVALAAIVLVVARRAWWAGFAIFFLWLPFEDLVRKFTSNDLRVYFVKDALFFLALFKAAPYLRNNWRRALGPLWMPTALVITVAVAFALPGLLTQPSIPFVGLHQKFLFAPILAFGVALVNDRALLERAMLWLSVLAAAVCLLGILQSFLGPTFLNPREIDPDLARGLNVIKSVGGDAVARPAGTFADVSRFASMTVVAVLLSLSALRVASTASAKRAAAVTLALSLAGGFASGSRTSLLVCIALLAFAMFSNATIGGRWRVVVTATLIVGAALVAGPSIVLRTSAATADLYATTLNPTSSTFEAGSRVRIYLGDALAGIKQGGLTGRGTGTMSTGRAYAGVAEEELLGGPESGWGAVALEWGILGFAVWTYWALRWTARAVRFSRRKNPARGPLSDLAAFYIGVVLLVMFWLGSGFFENYITNIFFWLFSGIAFGRLADDQLGSGGGTVRSGVVVPNLVASASRVSVRSG